MKKINEYTLPENLVELMKLERKYPSLESAPIEVRDKMTALALFIGGFEALVYDDKGYLNYLGELTRQLNELSISGTEEHIKKIQTKLGWFTSTLHNHYSETFTRGMAHQQKLANIYVEVEKYRTTNPESKIKNATDAVAKKLDEDPKYIHTRYYEFRKKSDNMPVDEVIKKFQLPTTS